MTNRSPVKGVLGNESGQAAALVALLLFFAFLAFASLAIDGGLFYLARRDLQNVADASALAACRVIMSGGDVTLAIATARDTVVTNLGSSDEFVGTNPPTTNVGSGANLTQGIEVSIPQVRVALQRPVPTMLKQFLNQPQTIALAQARCDSRAGGGLMPIAVQRYDGEVGGTLRDYLANKDASGVPPALPPVPYPSDSVTVTVNGRYSPPPWQVPVPMSQYTASDGAVTDSNTGPEVVLVGQSADTNNNESSMRSLVLLDIRNVASENALEYYNGADSQANAAKDMSQTWIYQHGYPGPYPVPGSQIAILDGASNAFAAGAMQNAGYRPGDTIAAIVYDGYVWTTPDFEVTLTPNVPSGITPGYPMDAGSAVVYTLAVAKAGPQPWFGAVDFNMTLNFANTPMPPGTQVTLDGNPLTPGVPYAVTGVMQTGWSGTLRIWSTEAVTQVRYLTGLNLIADSSLGSTRGGSSNFGFGALQGNDYSARTNSGRLVVRQGDSASANLITYGAGVSFPDSGQGCSANVQANILLGGTPQSWSTYFTSNQTTSVNIREAADRSLNFALSANAGAPVGSGYTLRLTVLSQICGTVSIDARSVDIPLTILPPAPNATPDRFVFIQGYAVFRISRVDANDVWGYAISPLYPDYNDITVGLQPRLVPW